MIEYLLQADRSGGPGGPDQGCLSGRSGSCLPPTRTRSPIFRRGPRRDEERLYRARPAGRPVRNRRGAQGAEFWAELLGFSGDLSPRQEWKPLVPGLRECGRSRGHGEPGAVRRGVGAAGSRAAGRGHVLRYVASVTRASRSPSGSKEVDRSSPLAALEARITRSSSPRHDTRRLARHHRPGCGAGGHRRGRAQRHSPADRRLTTALQRWHAFAPGSIGNVGTGAAYPGAGGGAVWATPSRPSGQGARWWSAMQDIRTCRPNRAGTQWPSRHAKCSAGPARGVGLALRVAKGLPLAGGQGGSAASAVAGAVAVNPPVGNPLERSPAPPAWRRRRAADRSPPGQRRPVLSGASSSYSALDPPDLWSCRCRRISARCPGRTPSIDSDAGGRAVLPRTLPPRDRAAPGGSGRGDGAAALRRKRCLLGRRWTTVSAEPARAPFSRLSRAQTGGPRRRCARLPSISGQRTDRVRACPGDASDRVGVRDGRKPCRRGRRRSGASVRTRIDRAWACEGGSSPVKIQHRSRPASWQVCMACGNEAGRNRRRHSRCTGVSTGCWRSGIGGPSCPGRCFAALHRPGAGPDLDATVSGVWRFQRDGVARRRSGPGLPPGREHAAAVPPRARGVGRYWPTCCSSTRGTIPPARSRIAA